MEKVKHYDFDCDESFLNKFGCVVNIGCVFSQNLKGLSYKCLQGAFTNEVIILGGGGLEKMAQDDGGREEGVSG